jgi:hypothetical protein
MIVFACSGFDGPPEALVRNIELSERLGAVAGYLCLASLALFAVRRIWWPLPALSATLFGLHPARTVSALNGDCGFFQRDAACAVTGLIAAVVCVQLACIVWTWKFPRPDGEATG